MAEVVEAARLAVLQQPREVAVAWAQQNWDDPTGERGPLRNLHVAAHMNGIGRKVSAGEISKAMTAARAERLRHGLPTGLHTVDPDDETAKEEIG